MECVKGVVGVARLGLSVCGNLPDASKQNVQPATMRQSEADLRFKNSCGLEFSIRVSPLPLIRPNPLRCAPHHG